MIQWTGKRYRLPGVDNLFNLHVGDWLCKGPKVGNER